jgi:hypothetical protein
MQNQTTSSTTDIDNDVLDFTLKETISVDTYSDDENAQMLNELNQMATQLNGIDYKHTGKIEDYIGLFQAAKGLINVNKTINANIDIDALESMAQSADQMTKMLTKYSEIISNNNYTIKSNQLIRKVHNALKKIFNFFIEVKKLEGTINATTKINVPLSISTMDTLINNIVPKISDASIYINYFADSESVTDENIINSAKMSDESLAGVNLAIDKLTNMNTIVNAKVNEQLDKLEQGVSTLIQNQNMMTNSLDKLSKKLANFL